MPHPARAALFAELDRLGIETVTREHDAVFTVEESHELKAQWPGGHTKNLFLTDRKGTVLLISAKDDTEVPLKTLHKHLDCKRLSFGNGELMQDMLGVTPGSVTAFALINAQKHAKAEPRLRFCLDGALLSHDPVHFHPLENTATTAISPQDLIRFAQACGFEPEILDFAAMTGGSAPGEA